MNPENAVAVATAALGLFATVGAIWYERRVPRRKRIGYRVQMDTAIGDNVRTGGANARLGLFDETPEMSDATLVLLRVENDGSQFVSDTDYTGRALHGLTAVFTDRTVRGLAVTAQAGADHLMEHFTPAAGLRYEGATVFIPRVPLDRGQHFKLLVLLTGGAVGSEVIVSGGLQAGAVQPNRSTTPDDKPPLFSRPAKVLTALLTVGVVTLASLILADVDDSTPIECASGELTVVGSTAFRPVVEELKEKYEDDCPGASITVSAHGSTAGIRELNREGARYARKHKKSPPMIALSDGPKSDAYPRLIENRVAISAYALVVNERVRLKNLSLTDVRRLYRGKIRNWKQLGGPDLDVSLISRNSSSGTYETLRRRVLGGVREIEPSSADCVHKDNARDPVIRCELDSTEQVLDTVSEVPGGIGYSELRAAEDLDGLHRLSLDGHAASADSLANRRYPLREIEYAYTYGSPPADSLASQFLTYARRSGLDVIRIHGHLPCSASEGLKACAELPDEPGARSTDQPAATATAAATAASR
nr:substrate-binding domain-containing protein [Streptomyces typhae]